MTAELVLHELQKLHAMAQDRPQTEPQLHYTRGLGAAVAFVEFVLALERAEPEKGGTKP